MQAKNALNLKKFNNLIRFLTFYETIIFVQKKTGQPHAETPTSVARTAKKMLAKRLTTSRIC